MLITELTRTFVFQTQFRLANVKYLQNVRTDTSLSHSCKLL